MPSTPDDDRHAWERPGRVRRRPRRLAHPAAAAGRRAQGGQRLRHPGRRAGRARRRRLGPGRRRPSCWRRGLATTRLRAARRPRLLRHAHAPRPLHARDRVAARVTAAPSPRRGRAGRPGDRQRQRAPAAEPRAGCATPARSRSRARSRAGRRRPTAPTSAPTTRNPTTGWPTASTLPLATRTLRVIAHPGPHARARRVPRPAARRAVRRRPRAAAHHAVDRRRARCVRRPRCATT